jgi:hypothetical protein
MNQMYQGSQAITMSDLYREISSSDRFKGEYGPRFNLAEMLTA